MADGPEKIRLDKWLWHARFFKTRGVAAHMATRGKIRVNGRRVVKAAYSITPGDTLTIPQGNRVRLVRMLAPGKRRGPAPEAQALYDDLDELPPSEP